MAQLNLLFCLLMSSCFAYQIVSCKKAHPSLGSNSISVFETNRQDIMPQNSVSPVESNPTIRASSFMVDPLVIIALIALPTIGILGLSSLIMPLIPIGIYLIQQFFPTSAGRRRRSVWPEPSDWEHRINVLAGNFNQMLDRFNGRH